MSVSVMAQISKTPKFLTKQALEYLRYIDKTGKYTYYQTSNGSLNLTSNYDNKVLLESIKGSHFLVHSSLNSKLILVELIEKLHSNINLQKNNKIYYSKIGENKLTSFADGIAPKSALKDTWVTYFDATNKSIHAKSLQSNKFYKVKLLNSQNTFFIPQVDMLNPETIIYTDINKSGYMAVLEFNTTDKKFFPIYKSKFAGSKTEFCLINDNLIIGEFGIYDSDKGSSLIQIPIYNNPGYKKQKIIYRSEQTDLGNIVCDESSVYFIKTLEFNSSLNSKVTEVAKLNLKNEKLSIETDLLNVSQIIMMGDRILVPYRDKFYIIKGDNDTTKQDVLEK